MGVAQSSQDSIFRLLPSEGEVAGIIAADSARVFTAEELYQFIDGGADLFFEYGFRRVIAQEYTGPGAIKLEIYEMTDPGAAYGIYSVRSGENATTLAIGNEGCRTAYYVMFWKGRYYLSVACRDTGMEGARIIESIARAVDGKISDRGEPPSLVRILRDKKPSKLVYFRGPLGMGTVYYFDEKLAFHAEEGIAGKFNDHVVIVFRYEDSLRTRRDFVRVDSILKSASQYTDYRVQGRGVVVKARSKQVLCFAVLDALLIVGIAENEKIASEGCKSVANRGL